MKGLHGPLSILRGGAHALLAQVFGHLPKSWPLDPVVERQRGAIDTPGLVGVHDCGGRTIYVVVVCLAANELRVPLRGHLLDDLFSLVRLTELASEATASKR